MRNIFLKERHRLQAKKQRKRYREEGRCINCGSIRDRLGKLTCSNCYISNKRSTQKREKIRIEKHICVKCGKNTVVENRKMCNKCLDKLKKLDRGKYNRKYYGHYREKRIENKLIAFNAYGGAKCVCCGETEFIFLTIDHINNNGNEHRMEIGKGSIYPWLKANNYPKGFQVLCFNCNQGKHINGGICPHKEINLRKVVI
jgi:hypothetical protein